MITAIEVIQRYLRPIIDVPVASKVPTRRPDLFVRIDQGTPKRINPVTDENIVFVQVYGVDLEEVLALIGAIQEHLFLIDTRDPFVQGWHETEGPHDYPDPDLDGSVFRWQMAGLLATTIL